MGMEHDQNLHNLINLLGVTAGVEEWVGDGLLISYRVRHIIVKLPQLPGDGLALLTSAGIIRYYLQEVDRRRQQWTSCHKQTQVSCEDREHYEHLREVLISF